MEITTNRNNGDFPQMLTHPIWGPPKLCFNSCHTSRGNLTMLVSIADVSVRKNMGLTHHELVRTCFIADVSTRAKHPANLSVLVL